MENSKLIDLLKTFNSGELLEFRDFVRSPFFNKNEELVQLYRYLKKAAPKFSAKKLERKFVYKHLFPKRTYDEKHLNYLMSFLLKLAEQYSGISFYFKQESLPEYHILSSLIDRNQEKSYNYTFQRTIKKLEKSPFRNMSYFYQQFLMADAANHYFSKQLIRKYDPSLQNTADFFDIYYLGNKLKYACEMLNRNRMISSNYNLEFLDEIRTYLSDGKHDDNPAIAIYYRILLLLSDKEPDPVFETLIGLLDKHESDFPFTELTEMYQYALNFCIRRINEGETSYLEKMLNLYMKGIDSGVLFVNGFLSPWAYKNVIAAGLRMRRFDWVEQFILKYNGRLSEEFQKNALHYNLAELYYYKKDFRKAQDHLNMVEFSDIYIALDSKKMLLKIFFESEEEEALFSALAAFKQYINRNKHIPGKVKTHYMNFHNILHQIIRQRNRSLLVEKMGKMETVADRTWLQKALEA